MTTGVSDPLADGIPSMLRLMATNALLMRDCALAGLGPTLLAEWMVGDDVAAGDLVDLFPKYVVSAPNAPTTAWAVYLDPKQRAGQGPRVH